jgi:integrase
MNKRCRAITQDEYKKIISTIREGFNYKGQKVKGNERIAVALVLEANLGIRISDILNLHMTDFIKDGNRYRIDIIEKKTLKVREFTIPIEIFSYIQAYTIENGIAKNAKLFSIHARVVQKHLKMVAEVLELERIGTHSLRKFFSTKIYVDSGYNIELVRKLLQHSSVAITQRYISIESREVENALNNHICLP